MKTSTETIGNEWAICLNGNEYVSLTFFNRRRRNKIKTMKNNYVVLALVGISVLALTGSAWSAAIEHEDFNAGSPGWSGGNPETWTSFGGAVDNGAHIYSTRTDGGRNYLTTGTNAKFDGDWVTKFGSGITVSFYLKDGDGTGSDTPLFNILSGGTWWRYLFTSTPLPNDGSWTLFSIDIDANDSTGWIRPIGSKSYIDTLQAVDDLYFHGNGNNGLVNETLALDEVTVETIPEPATLGLLAMAALSLVRRKRR